LLHLLLIARVNIDKHGECKYFLGGDMSVLLFKNLKSVLEKKNGTVYICNGIWTVVLVKHLTICLIKIIFILILHIDLE